ncbi:helix-turn-helix domain-containing protein [Amycolatopsis solani]|nr:helix-turn-helix domain-containing protein [Amycolatopsis sp. MEP2-6]
MINLGIDLRELRISARLTQEELAKRLGGRQQGWVSEVENGSRRGRPITWDDVSNWLKACGVDAALREEWRLRYTPIEMASDLRNRKGAGKRGQAGEERAALPSETTRITDEVRKFKALFWEEFDAAREQARRLKGREEQLTSELAEITGKIDDLKLQCHQAEQQIATDGRREQHLRQRIRGLREQLRSDDETIHVLEKEIQFTREQRRIAEETSLRMGRRTAEVALRSRAASDLLSVLLEATWADRREEPETKTAADADRKKSVPEIRKLEPVTTRWPGEVGRPRTLVSTLSIIALAILLVVSLVALIF